MKAIKQLLAQLFLMFTLSACSNQVTLPPLTQPLNTNPAPFVDISLFVSEPENADRNYFAYIQHIRQSVTNSQIFNSVDTTSLNKRYRIRMVFERQTNDTNVGVFAQLLSAATLFLIPAKADTTYILDVAIFDNETLLDSFRYKDNTQVYTNLFTLGDDFELKEIDKLLSYFYRDLQQANSLPGA